MGLATAAQRPTSGRVSAWQGSTRRSRLPDDWEARRAASSQRAGGRCEGITLAGEERWHVDECDGVGTDCDHDVPGDDHELDNLRWLSGPCHDRKTLEEHRRRASRARRPLEQHPAERLAGA